MRRVSSGISLLTVLTSRQCHDSLALISLYLQTPSKAIDPDTPQDTQEPTQDNALSLLAPEIETFYSHLPSLITPFSALLSTALTELRTISTTSTDASTGDTVTQPSTANANTHTRSASNHNARARARDRRVRTSLAPAPPLASQLRDRVQALHRTQLSSLPVARRQMAATAAAVLAVRTLVLERSVVILERVKHGALARATKAKAEHLATVAQGVEGKIECVQICAMRLCCAVVLWWMLMDDMTGLLSLRLRRRFIHLRRLLRLSGTRGIFIRLRRNLERGVRWLSRN